MSMQVTDVVGGTSAFYDMVHNIIKVLEEKPKSDAELFLGLAGEVGEVCNEMKKALRDNDGTFPQHKIIDELGDVLWYVLGIMITHGISLDDLCEWNNVKLASREAVVLPKMRKGGVIS